MFQTSTNSHTVGQKTTILLRRKINMKGRNYQDLIIKYLTAITHLDQPEHINIYLDLIRILLKPFPLAHKDFTNRITTLTTKRDEAIKHIEYSIEAYKIQRECWEQCIIEIYDVLSRHNLLPSDMINPYINRRHKIRQRVG